MGNGGLIELANGSRVIYRINIIRITFVLMVHNSAFLKRGETLMKALGSQEKRSRKDILQFCGVV